MSPFSCTSATAFAAGYGLMNYAAISAKFDFHGKTAHGAVDPWNGKDAVDAVELMDIGFDKLREHLHPTYRAHRAITAGGIQPNIIADYGQIWWFVRDADMPSAKETFDKLVKIAEGAALMTGTTWDYKIDAAAWPQLGLKPVAEAIQANIETVGMPQLERGGAGLRPQIPDRHGGETDRTATPRRRRSASDRNRRRRTTMATSPGWCRARR